MVHLGIAKFVQDRKKDFELFAIVNARDNKRFFQKQRLVTFQKTFYLHDHISDLNYKPNEDYLQSIEKQYRINLFQIADYDQEFHFAITKATRNKILAVLEQDCRFFESVLNEVNPQCLCIKPTDRHHNQLLSEICKSKGIKVLMLVPARLGNRWMITEQMDKIDSDVDYDAIKYQDKTYEKLQTYLQDFVIFKNAGKDTILYQTSNKQKIHAIMQYRKTIPRFAIKQVIQKMKKKYRKNFIDRNFKTKIQNNDSFFYFPMHVEPERALYIAAPFYTNQLDVITNVAKSLPVGYYLYVKDHPGMHFFGWRQISYYKRLLSLPNVKVIHPSISPDLILKNCSGVITIGGSSALEACFYKKPVILFGDLSYSRMPSVHKVERLEDLPVIIRRLLEEEPKSSDLSKFVEYLEKNSISCNMPDLLSDLYKEMYYGGLLTTADISEQKLNSYFEKHKKTFSILADEYIKKITLIKI